MTAPRKPRFLIALAFLMLAHSYNAFPQNYPAGSYSLSCNSIAVENNILSATCRKLDGEYQSTSLNNLDMCLNSITMSGDIGNIDGNLICIPDIPKVLAGFNFPESETTINQWIYSKQSNDIHQHGWGIWAGLTQYVGSVDATSVRAFESWATVSNMLFRMENETTNKALMIRTPQKPQGLDLKPANQFKNKAGIKGKLKRTTQAVSKTDGDTNIFVSVAYNPPAAIHAISNKLFLQSTLDQYLKNGYEEIPNFPNNAITIKPVYKIISANTPKGIYKFPGWPGTPNPAKTFAESDWNSCVYVDIRTTGKGGKSIDKGCKGQSAANTFHLNNFIHQKISAEDAGYLSSQLNLKVSPGDYAILVGMHVTSREIKRWTWQTFWWSANPDAPFAPSSQTIANIRPLKSLDEASQHYAMSVAYQMVDQAQAITGGQNIGQSHIAYNPHLEAGFDPGVFQIIRKINGSIDNKYGVQTNCMTCHNLAQYNPTTNYRTKGGANREKPYGTDYYMGINDATFKGSLKLDFAWSVLGAMKLDGAKP